jgi:hypothetical protein
MYDDQATLGDLEASTAAAELPPGGRRTRPATASTGPPPRTPIQIATHFHSHVDRVRFSTMIATLKPGAARTK